MKIDNNDPRITAYVFDELDDNDRTAFENELQDSHDLRELVEQTRKAVSLIESDLAAAPVARLHPEQRRAVVSTMEGSGPAGPAGPGLPPSAHRTFPSWAIAAIAATLLLCVGGMLAFVGQNARITAMRKAVDSAGQNAERAGRGLNESMQAPMEAMATEGDALAAQPFGGDGGDDAAEPSGLPLSPEPSRSARVAGAPPASATQSEAAIMSKSLARPAPASPAADSAPKAIASPQGQALGQAQGQALGQAPGQAEAPSATLPLQTEPAPEPDVIPAEGSADKFAGFVENNFVPVLEKPRSTFSVDVDTASYSKVRQLLNSGSLPPAGAVRLEELINYFPYRYAGPDADDDTPFASHLAVSACPWAPKHRLIRIAMKAREVDAEQRPSANLVFLVDVSGSMESNNKLPLLKRGLQRMTRQLRDDDRIAVVTYSGKAELYLDSTPGSERESIIEALEQLKSGGSTNGSAGIQLAYDVARRNFVQEGINRVILCSDGDFNVGHVRDKELTQIIAKEAESNVAITVLGFGMGNHNDLMMEKISNRGNGNYAFIDNDAEADKVLVQQINGTLLTVAKDVKIQVNFNHNFVKSYRMLGYENRKLRNKDFDDDTKDAGDIGAGHTVTMLYEIMPVAEENEEVADASGNAQQSKYFAKENAESNELLELSVRYKRPTDTQSRLQTFPLPKDAEVQFGQADQDLRFAAAIASFGMLLRDSKYQGDTSYDAVLEIAQEAAGQNALRLELLQLIRQAKAIAGK